MADPMVTCIHDLCVTEVAVGGAWAWCLAAVPGLPHLDVVDAVQYDIVGLGHGTVYC
jgi:hypothetical protein